LFFNADYVFLGNNRSQENLVPKDQGRMMSVNYTIGALWMEGALSYLEQLCLKSFVDAGHRVVLYHYGPLENVPKGIELADANDIMSRDNFLTHKRTGSPALHSDLFRYNMLKKERNIIWADTDAYCMKRFETANGHFYGWESPTHLNGGVLGLPHDSDTLTALLNFTSDEFAIPTYYGAKYVNELRKKRDEGNPVHASEQPWGVWGPHAVTHFLKETGEIKYALPAEGLYPFAFKDRKLMLQPHFDTSPYITDNTYSVHLYGRRMRARLSATEGGVPHPKSLLGKLLIKHGIDPYKAPIIVKSRDPLESEDEPEMAKKPKTSAEKPDAEKPIPASAKYGRGLMNLTDLADSYGSDKGSTKHRYTELYQLLFQPRRDQNINFLEMGLQIGGPEHGQSEDRKTTDLPSVRMWMEYFPKAHITGLDISDFSWFQDERFSFVRCDMDRRENIAKAKEKMPEFDIIIDDASHASHHQQNAFIELFPKVKSGGLYIIEDLRWQPEPYERKGITKTAALIQNYLLDGVFTHEDASIAAGFNDQRLDISGCFVFQVLYNKTRKDQVAVFHKR
jgi:hypothetical protein